jgi:hypothetical protein
LGQGQTKVETGLTNTGTRILHGQDRRWAS